MPIIHPFSSGNRFRPLRVIAPFDAPQVDATFAEAISRFWRKYVTFTGRASLSEFWRVVAFELIVFLVFFALVITCVGLFSAPMSGGSSGSFGASDGGEAAGRITYVVMSSALVVYRLATLLPWIALAVRRLHDANLSGAFVLFAIIGFGFVVLILCALRSDPAGARYDSPPAVTR